MFPGLNPKKINALMKQMGVSQEEIDAEQVIIKKSGGDIVINNPRVVKINMQGQDNFQISGDISKENSEQEAESEEDTIEQDIKLIMEKCNCLEQEAKLALEKANGDVAEAILSLS